MSISPASIVLSIQMLQEMSPLPRAMNDNSSREQELFERRVERELVDDTD
ncbi:MAG: hypothetical protein ABJ205_12230 [Erythrobacter sp.]